MHINEMIGSWGWKNLFVQITDYIANTAIGKKNFLILEELTDKYLPALEKNKNWLKEI